VIPAQRSDRRDRPVEDWRAGYRALSRAERKQLRTQMWAGRGDPDPARAPTSLGYAVHYARGPAWWSLLQALLPAAFLVVFAVNLEGGRPGFWIFLLYPAVFGVVSVTQTLRRRRGARQAATYNRSTVDRQRPAEPTNSTSGSGNLHGGWLFRDKYDEA
jgi:hypothetical protein